ncbi:Solitary outer membrane autotransporter beta-barrel domain [Vibrio sp. LaRot3]|uniref:Solitary outer membrane autotransporter beta-barrel domain n=1 Tax=Vibrio sp. LaRot3 TaxID=2998829 RepID=UPI0022CDC28F|nr:Solitary outer membrane autotransporter beta-barrel domain [Vibrio sp. LaRot3]MDA0148357.1 Solitary outer membrane autotransporter beta-barrel domain [Vibrio sp. LaRot3]
MNKQTKLVAAFAALLPMSANAQGYKEVQTYLEQAFSAAIVMTDSDVVTFGVHDFDPNEWFNLQNENLGSADSINLRQQFAVSALPYTYELSDEDSIHKSQLFMRFSALVSRQDVEIYDGIEDDYQRETVLGGYAAYRYQYQINDAWQVTPGLGVHLQHFRNEHDYRTDLTKQFFKPFLDGLMFNTTAWAATIEPHVTLKYNHDTEWGSWNASSSAHYFYGKGWGDANFGQVGNPEGWYVANGAEIYYNVAKWGRSVQSLFSSVRRVDLGGDSENPFGTHYYYETSVGWLMTPPFKSDWIDNIGIGLNINYGSKLKGGSIVLFFNQD